MASSNNTTTALNTTANSSAHESTVPPTFKPPVDSSATSDDTNTTPTPNATPPKPNFLVWPSSSWIASHLITLLTEMNHTFSTTTIRTENRESVMSLLQELKPTHVLLCAGVTGRPNVDWCEDHKIETIRSNVIGVLNVVDCCYLMGVHVTVFGTGCIYTYDNDHPQGSGKGFLETDLANFSGSYYSQTKALTETLLKSKYCETNALMLRLRMPVSDDLHPRSFVTKITKYEHVVDIPNSNTILNDLLPCAILLAEHSTLGIFNFTNPGAISHNEVLTMYRDLVDPTFKWSNFTLAEQALVIKADRSNCELDSSKLVTKIKELGGPDIPEIHNAYRQCFARMKKGSQQCSFAPTIVATVSSRGSVDE